MWSRKELAGRREEVDNDTDGRDDEGVRSISGAQCLCELPGRMTRLAGTDREWCYRRLFPCL